MITMDLPMLLFVPFLFALVSLFLAALYYAGRRTAPTLRTSKARIYRCTVCAHVYEDARDVPLARCPRCSCSRTSTDQ